MRFDLKILPLQKIEKPLSDYNETNKYFKLETTLRSRFLSSCAILPKESFFENGIFKTLSQNFIFLKRFLFVVVVFFFFVLFFKYLHYENLLV